MTGRRASRSTRAAVSTSRTLAPADVTLTGRYASINVSGTSSFRMSAGISTIAGPGRPMRIRLMARRMTSTTWLPTVMVSTDLVTDAYVRAELNKGKTWARSRGWPSGRSSIGVESEYAVATPGKVVSAWYSSYGGYAATASFHSRARSASSLTSRTRIVWTVVWSRSSTAGLARRL